MLESHRRHTLLGGLLTSLLILSTQTAPAQQIARRVQPANKPVNQGPTLTPPNELPPPPAFESGVVPADFTPWWQKYVVGGLRKADHPLAVTQDGLMVGALRHSAQVRVFTDIPLIRETAIQEAWGEFDWRKYLNSRWIDTSDPVGSTLTTGGPDRYRNNQWAGEGGFRHKNIYGGRFDIKQQFGFQDTNSVFFVPNPQGTSRIMMSYTQPLLNGRGEVYNTSLIVLAKIDSNIAQDELNRQLQSHLLEVSRAYWSLYRERAVLVQKLNWYEEAKVIVGDLEKRQDVDAAKSQVLRAQAASSLRLSDILRQETAVKNSEARLRALVNDPILEPGDLEFLPTEAPTRVKIPVDMQDSKTTAMQLRPELAQTIKQIRAASVRADMAINEMLPVLNVVLETYVAGLRGNTDIGQAWVDQFSQGEPSYTAGLQFEVPFCNNVAKARLRRRQLEIRQLQSQFQAAVQTLMLEVETAVREVETSYAEMQAKYRAMVAGRAEVNYVTERYKALPGDQGSAVLFLDNVLLAQDRLADAELGFATAEVTYNLSLINLKRAIGTLLQAEDVSQSRTCVDGLPMLVVDSQSLQPIQPTVEDIAPAPPAKKK